MRTIKNLPIKLRSLARQKHCVKSYPNDSISSGSGYGNHNELEELDGEEVFRLPIELYNDNG